MVARRLDDFFYPGFVADIAGVDAQTGSARFGGLDPAPIVEMNIRHDGHRAFPNDLFQRPRRRFVRNRYANDIRTRLGRRLHLRHGRRHIGGQRIGHGLNGNGCIASNGDVADHDLTGFTTIDVAPWAHVIEGHKDGSASA